MKIRVVPTGPIKANCYIVFDEKSLEGAVIDPGSFDSLVQSAIDGLKIKYIICTHGHFDHILGVGEMQKATGAKLLIHKDDEECLTESRANLIDEEYFGRKIILKADRLLSDGYEIRFGDITLEVIHTPGHSRGSIVLADKKNRILFTGDTLFAGGTGRTDFYGSDINKMRQSVKRLLSLEGDYHILPGHDSDTFLSDERKYYL